MSAEKGYEVATEFHHEAGDVAPFIRARLDEDEAAAKLATQGDWRADGEDIILVSDDPHWNGLCIANASGYDGEHIARYDPPRALREVRARRAVLALHKPNSRVIDQWTRCYHCNDSNGDYRPYPCQDVLLLAAVWSDHPDYRKEWVPPG